MVMKMAMIDFGAIAFKNGKKISTEMFTPMRQMVGWEDVEEDKKLNSVTGEYESIRLVNNYFAYIGDEEVTICFYREHLVVCVKECDEQFEIFANYFNSTYYKWHKWVKPICSSNGISYIKVFKRNGYYVCKWRYKGDDYKVYFGYGVDLHFYEKTHRVNYYRSPEYLISTLLHKFKK